MNGAHNAYTPALAEEALGLFEQLESQDGLCRALRALGISWYRAGDPARAAQALERAIALTHEEEDTNEAWECLYYLFAINPGRGMELCAQELAHARAGGNAGAVSLLLVAHADFLLAAGEYERARRGYEEALGSTAHWLPLWVWALTGRAYIEFAQGHLGRAMDTLDQLSDQSLKLMGELGSEPIRDVSRYLVAYVRIAEGDLAAATQNTRASLRQFQRRDNRALTVRGLVQMADVAWRVGDLRRASGLLGAAQRQGDALNALDWRLPMGTAMWRWHYDAQRTVVAPALAAARAQLGDAEFEAVYAAGQRMTLDEAVAYALQDGGAEEPPANTLRE
jgi:tetratricopeptide (TPR) repeat protein